MVLKKLDMVGARQSVAMQSDPSRVDPRKLKLGKGAARHDPRALLMASYSTACAAHRRPRAYDLTTKLACLGNDGKRSARRLHLRGRGSPDHGVDGERRKKMVTPTDKQIVAAYSAITGYNPATGANDNGAVEVDVLNFWRQSGIAGHKIGAYMALEPANHTHVMDSVYMFEGCYIGVQLPISAQDQVKNHQPWSVPPGGPTGDGKPGSWGGHAVPVVAYDIRGVTVVTWGALQMMTWGFWEAYCEESYAILSTDYLTGKKTTPQGFNLQQLQADLADLK